jgi:hypothetical protein
VITSETKLRDEDYGMILDTLCLDGKVGTLIVPRKLVSSLMLHGCASSTISCPRTVQSLGFPNVSFGKSADVRAASVRGLVEHHPPLHLPGRAPPRHTPRSLQLAGYGANGVDATDVNAMRRVPGMPVCCCVHQQHYCALSKIQSPCLLDWQVVMRRLRLTARQTAPSRQRRVCITRAGCTDGESRDSS